MVGAPRFVTGFKARSGLSGWFASTLTAPPAFSMAATAFFEAPSTSKLSFALMFAFGEDLDAVARPRATPAATKASIVTGLAASSLPASTAA